MTEAPIAKFQSLLRELFQFDCADLDFGIYRIMNHKRAIVERFITADLPKTIAEELRRGALAEQGQAQEALAAARQRVLDALGEEALDANGGLKGTFRNTPAGKAYLEAQAKAQGARSMEALETAIYNHLYTFFSRYWQEGDFISKRRYSRKERYAIPYNGEEVTLYWANHDQYYVKSGEYFTDYTYQAPNGVSVHFKLQQADVEQNNVKSDKRFFLPRLEGIAWDETARTLTIPFEYRPLTAQETIAYGQKNQQEAIIVQAVAAIPKRVKAAEALSALTAERRRTEKGETVSWLEHHLRQYTRRNTGDFFIHKDLRGFLARELDFYLKNEVLNLEELEAAGDGLTEGWFQLLRLIKCIGLKIIEFLAQIEDFQKMLWEKKKFITETFYVVTVGNIPEVFYPEIAACEAQWEEWKALLALDVPKSAAKRGELLKTHPTLPLDTRRFPPDFTDRLLASFEDLDGMTDGLLVHSENWQALNLLQEKYRERIKCIYIDPPFNTGTNEFLYKNDYLNSSWLAMLRDRLIFGHSVLSPLGNFFCRIDHHGDFWVRQLLNMVFGETRYQNQIVLKRGRETAGTRSKLEVTSETLYWFSTDEIAQFNEIAVNRSIADVQWTAFLMGGERHPREREFLGKTLIPPDGQHFSLAQSKVYNLLEEHFIRLRCSSCGAIYFCADDDESLHRTMKKKNNRYKYYDISRDKVVHGVRKIDSCIECGGDDWRVDYLGAPTVNLSNIWLDLESYSKSTGFFTENSEVLLRRVIELTSNQGEYILDYFLGSGTTAAVAQKLKRKWIGVEVGEYFDSIPFLRIKKVLSGDAVGISREVKHKGGGIVKVIRLESYEDALNNLTFDDAGGQQALELFKGEYLLSYMLKWETRHSETLLNVEKLQTPFAYKLHLHRDGETRERPVDLPETFNYLLGLDVQTRRVLPSPSGRGAGGEVRYLIYRGTLRNGRTVAVIWRETQGWTAEDYERDAAFVAEHKLTAGADEIYVNGDSRIPGARSLDPIFKERMFAGMEV